MRASKLRMVLIGSCALLASAGAVQGSVVSTFDTGGEGWSLANGGGSFTWSSTLGNPGGGISGNDDVSNQLWYFSAPAAFLGDQSAMLGGTFSWDRRYVGGGSSLVGDSIDIIMQAGALRIGYSIPGNLDLPTWQTLSVPLSAPGWFIAAPFPTPPLSGAAVTPAQFAQVLAGLTNLYIQGEYRNGNDTGALDNVIMMGPLPTPCGPSDIAGPGGSIGPDGEVTADDILRFISAFTSGTLVVADIAGPGGLVGPDGELTADDILLFISRFTEGC